MKKNNIVVNVMSFNRPDYLRQVLLGLKENEGVEDFTIRLFQDGALNFITFKKYVEQSIIDQCVNVFKEIFPEGEVFESHNNLGVGLNYDRAESQSFIIDSFEGALFIEDDFVPSPDYLNIILKLYELTRYNPLVCTLSAYGLDEFTSFEQQEANQFKLGRAIPSWGYFIPRDKWLKRLPYYRPYLDLIRFADYREKPDAQICNWLRSMGFSRQCTSQDAAHSAATVQAGMARLMTFTRNATYIGAKGLHFSEAEYEAGYYGKDPVWEYKSHDFIIPSDDEILAMLANIKEKELI